MEVADQPVAPAATPVLSPEAAAVTSGDFAAAEAIWREQDAKPTPKPAPAAAKPVDQAGSTESTSKPQSEAAHQKASARERARDVDADIRELNERLRIRAELRKELDRREPTKIDEPKAPSATTAPIEKFPSYAEYLTEHPDADFEGEYLNARDDWRDQRKEAARAQVERHTAVTRMHQQVAESFREQFDAAQKDDPDFLVVDANGEVVRSKVSPEVLTLRPVEALKPGEPFGPKELLGSELLKSSVAPKLMTYWTEHPDELKRLQTVPEHLRALPTDERGRPYHLWLARELGKLEASFERPITNQPKTVTSAPPPPQTLGSRPAMPADAEQDAVKRGDFAAAERIWREQDAAKFSRR